MTRQEAEGLDDEGATRIVTNVLRSGHPASQKDGYHLCLTYLVAELANDKATAAVLKEKLENALESLRGQGLVKLGRFTWSGGHIGGANYFLTELGKNWAKGRRPTTDQER